MKDRGFSFGQEHRGGTDCPIKTPVLPSHSYLAWIHPLFRQKPQPGTAAKTAAPNRMTLGTGAPLGAAPPSGGAKRAERERERELVKQILQQNLLQRGRCFAGRLSHQLSEDSSLRLLQ